MITAGWSQFSYPLASFFFEKKTARELPSTNTKIKEKRKRKRKRKEKVRARNAQDCKVIRSTPVITASSLAPRLTAKNLAIHSTSRAKSPAFDGTCAPLPRRRFRRLVRLLSSARPVDTAAAARAWGLPAARSTLWPGRPGQLRERDASAKQWAQPEAGRRRSSAVLWSTCTPPTPSIPYSAGEA